jgi:alpha-beta hydrolase superfamily lysophospholipase
MFATLPRTLGVLSLLAVLFLAPLGCAPATDRDARLAGIGTARAAPSPKPAPRILGDEFVTADGTILPMREWLPQGRPKAVILALHGFNDYSHAFSGPGKAWATLGIATYAYDQRGFGAAPGAGFWPGIFPLAADAATASRILRQRYPGVPLYLLGESMGGAVAAVAMTGESGPPIPDVDGVILVAPAVWGRATMGPLKQVALWVGARLFPGWRFTGRGLGILPSDNMPMLRELARDPLVIKATRIDTIYGLVNLMGAALRSARRLDMPLLVLYGAKDEIIPEHAVRLFVRELPPDPGARPRLAYYQNGYHMLLRDLEAPLVVQDVASWVLAPEGPLPSGAERAAEAFFGRR